MWRLKVQWWLTSLLPNAGSQLFNWGKSWVKSMHAKQAHVTQHQTLSGL
jgi:hypothetical protein